MNPSAAQQNHSQNAKWEVVIGLETHAQLLTKSKIFSPASTAFGAEPNENASAICIALPGTLPVLNKQAVQLAIRFGLAVNGKVAEKSIFDRKNYFYPDLPKAYQISQFEFPVVIGGALDILLEEGSQTRTKTIHLTRAHLEEDAGKSLHEAFPNRTGIDLNRAGTPLLEIVSEPEMRSSEEAVAYAKALHALVQWIGICDGNMQEGSFRCDANVSVRPFGQKEFGTRREIKNLNSFRFMQQAIDYEIAWQNATIEGGGKVVQSTVLFDAETGETRAMRSKEDAHDYRYFPDPDLFPLVISQEWIEKTRQEMPELPQDKRARFTNELQLSAYDAQVLTSSLALANYFDASLNVAGKINAKLCANFICGELSARLNKDNLEINAAKITAAQLGALILRIGDQTISNAIAKKVFEALWNGEAEGEAKTADEIIEQQGLRQMNDLSAIEKLIDEVLAANAKMVEEFHAGKEKAFNALVGQAMKATKGRANPQQVNEILKEKLRT